MLSCSTFLTFCSNRLRFKPPSRSLLAASSFPSAIPSSTAQQRIKRPYTQTSNIRSSNLHHAHHYPHRRFRRARHPHIASGTLKRALGHHGRRRRERLLSNPP